MQNGNVLTRRAAIGVCAAAVSQACSPVRSSQGGRPLPPALANLAAEFLLFDKDGFYTRGLDGKKFHCLPVPKGTWAVSVSADGSAAAWTPARIPSLTEPDGGLYLVRNRKSGNDHDIVIPAIFPILSALSSSGSHVAAVSARPHELNWKLFFFMLDEKGVTNQHDLSALCDPALLKNAETLGICERGETLVIGSREAFQVIDLVKQQVLSRVEGRFPSLRPSGDKIAFATPSRALAIQEVRTRKTTNYPGIYRLWGVGAWSPDGRFVILSKTYPWHFWEKDEVLFNPESGTSFKIDTLGDGEWGTDTVWLRRGMLRFPSYQAAPAECE